MKKRSIALLCCCVQLFLSGCGSGGQTMQGTGPATLDALPKEQSVQYRAELEEVSGESYEGDALLLTYRYEVPVLRACGSDGEELAEEDTPERARNALSAFNSNFSYWRDGEDAREVESWAREDYAVMKDILPIWTENRGYATELSCTLYETERFLSVQGMYYSFTGGAHPNTMFLAWNFDLESGSFVEPSFLAADAQTFQDVVTAEIIRQAEAVAGEAGQEPDAYYWENYRDIAADWANYAVAFEEDGMVVTFSPYEMACYAAGAQVFRLDRDFLGEYLSPEGLRLLGYEG